MGKRDVVHTFHGMLLRNTQNEIMPFTTTWIDPGGNMLCGVAEKDKDHVISLVYEI